MRQTLKTWETGFVECPSESTGLFFIEKENGDMNPINKNLYQKNDTNLTTRKSHDRG